MFEAQRSVLVKFVRKCRRYFPSGTAAEVWEQCKGPLASPLQPAAFEVFGACFLFAPLCIHTYGTKQELPIFGHTRWVAAHHALSACGMCVSFAICRLQ